MIGFLKKKLILQSCYFTIAAVMNYHKVSTSKLPLFIIFLFYISIWASVDYTQGVHRPCFSPGSSMKESGAFLHQRINCQIQLLAPVRLTFLLSFLSFLLLDCCEQKTFGMVWRPPTISMLGCLPPSSSQHQGDDTLCSSLLLSFPSLHLKSLVFRKIHLIMLPPIVKSVTLITLTKSLLSW